MKDIRELKFDIHATFFPGQHIVQPSWFAGRKLDFERALKSLCRPGASIIVYGERGVGKSSFVEMIKLVASGQDPYLLFRYGFHKLFPPDRFRYKIISIECDADTNTTTKVLQRLITSPNGIKSVISSRLDKTEISSKDKLGISLLKMFNFGFDDEAKKTFNEFKEETAIELFTNLIQTIEKEILLPAEGILICIDEFDLIEDNSKMASLIKTLSKNNIKFLISGIADTYESLIAGHQSVLRNFFQGKINIRPMLTEEVIDIFNLVEKNSEGTLNFSKAFLDGVVEQAQGFPYYAQLFGQLALDEVIEQNPLNRTYTIQGYHLKAGLKRLVEYEPDMDREYITIVNESPEREFVLRFLARQIPKKIKDKDLFTYCNKRSFLQSKQTLANLLGQRNPQFLIREKDSEFVFFSNALFKTFVNSREPIFLKIDKNELVLP